jgi:hypothetical protein
MPKVSEITYYLDSGTRVTYRPEGEPEAITEEAMGIIIQLVDGKPVEELNL